MEFPHKKPISYSCVKCGYTTNRKSNYMYHINRKIPCVAVVNNLSENVNIEQNVNQLQHDVNLNQNMNLSNQNYINPEQHDMNLNQNVNLEQQHVNLEQCNITENLENEQEMTCVRCNKTLSSKQSLERHLKICQGVHSLQCPKCKKEFNSAQGKYKHLKHVKCVPINPHYSTTINNNTNNNTTNNNTTNNNKRTITTTQQITT